MLFAGKAPDRELHSWYEAADLFVHPTLYEGSSLVTLEAMAHRRACVVTDAGGLPDKVKNGVNGWIVPAGDPAALAAAISGALEDRARLKRMGDEGRAIVERHFSWASAVQETIRLITAAVQTACSAGAQGAPVAARVVSYGFPLRRRGLNLLG